MVANQSDVAVNILQTITQPWNLTSVKTLKVSVYFVLYYRKICCIVTVDTHGLVGN